MKKLIKRTLDFKKFLLRDIARSTAFLYRNYYATKRRLGWFFATTFYHIVSGSAVIFIGKAANDEALVQTLFIGTIVWTYLSTIFDEISGSISLEKWESTVEYTFAAPVTRASHLLSISLYSTLLAGVRTLLLMSACIIFFDINITFHQSCMVIFILFISTLSCIGIGLMAAILPLISIESGPQATYIVQGILLIFSGVYYKVDILPNWAQTVSKMSPITYTLDACRKVLENNNGIQFELYMIGIISIITIPLSLYVFSIAEHYTKVVGKLKRNG